MDAGRESSAAWFRRRSSATRSSKLSGTLPNRTWERPALVTYLWGNHAVCSERWRYIRYADGSEELYDMKNDPNEWDNLAGRPELAAVKADLAKWLPKADAPNLSGKTTRKQERKAE